MSKSPPRADTAYLALRQAIIEQALMPGAKLPEDQLGAHFGISRTLVRSVLARLVGAGLVDTRPKRTATVAQPTLDEARAIFEVRRALEREAVSQAVRRWRPEFGAVLEGHVREEDAAKARGDEKVSIRLAGEFHIKLAVLAGNPILERYLAELVSRCSLILAIYGRPHSSECAVNEHLEIIAAMRQGDAVGAIRLMDEHVGSVERRAVLGHPPADAELGAVLSRYAAAIDARATVTPIGIRASSRGRR